MGDEILSILPSKLIQFINSDDLEVEKEETVFQVVLRWYNHSPEERSKDFAEVLKYVRLPLISPYFLHDCVASLPVIRQSAECLEVVEEAKLYHMLPDRRCELQTSRTKHRKSAGTVHVRPCLLL